MIYILYKVQYLFLYYCTIYNILIYIRQPPPPNAIQRPTIQQLIRDTYRTPSAVRTVTMPRYVPRAPRDTYRENVTISTADRAR